jgi:hypothetical protein|nr:MAG TPA: hypothetical protein [Caudoviricetes sp.]
MTKNSDKSTNVQRKLLMRSILIKIAGAIILIGCATYEPFYRIMVIGILLIMLSEM